MTVTRTSFVFGHLRAELGRLDGTNELHLVSPTDWAAMDLLAVDRAAGWTAPSVMADPLFRSFPICTSRIDATTGWLRDVQQSGPRYSYTSDWVLIPSIDNYARIIADLLIGEAVAHLRHADDPQQRRCVAEAELAARHPQAIRLLSAVQARALDP